MISSPLPTLPRNPVILTSIYCNVVISVLYEDCLLPTVHSDGICRQIKVVSFASSHSQSQYSESPYGIVWELRATDKVVRNQLCLILRKEEKENFTVNLFKDIAGI